MNKAAVYLHRSLSHDSLKTDTSFSYLGEDLWTLGVSFTVSSQAYFPKESQTLFWDQIRRMRQWYRI